MGSRLFMGLWAHVNSSDFIVNTMPCSAGEEIFPKWSGLPSQTPCGLEPSAFTDKAGSCSETMLPGSLSASVSTNHTKKRKALLFQNWEKDACWSALGQTKADLGHWLSKHVSSRTRLCLKLHSYIIIFSPVSVYSGFFLSTSSWP